MQKKRGFSLIELIVVIALIVLLSTLTLLETTKLKAQARLSDVSADLDTIAKSVNQYADDNNYQYPPDTSRGVPPGLQPYLQGGVWPTGPWPNGEFDWDNWPYTYHGLTTPNGVPAQYQPYLNEQVLQITYHLCPIGDSDPSVDCVDPQLFPTFVEDSGIFYCINGPCIPHQDEPDIPGYCVNCKIKPVNF